MKKVRFIALGSSAAEAPPIAEGETWGIQYTWQHWKVDRAFVMDDSEWIIAKNHSFSNPLDVEGDMRTAGVPIYVAKKWETVPNTVEYPIEEIKKHFKTNYFMNSIAYMFALAIYEGFERIECFGTDFRYFNELGEVLFRPPVIDNKVMDYEEFMKLHHNWLDETHCGAFWAGVAKGKGIEVVVTDRSSLMKPVYPGEPSLYGYEVSPTIEKQRERILKSRNKVELKQTAEKLMIFRPQPGEDLKEFMKKVSLKAVKPIGSTSLKTWTESKKS